MASSSLRLVLVDPSPSGANGSMSRYAELVTQSLQDLPEFRVAFDLRALKLSVPRQVADRLTPRLRTWANHLWLMIAGPARIRRLKPDLVHLLDGSYGYLLCGFGEIPAIATVHDLIPLLQQQGRFGPDRSSRLARGLIKRSLAGLRGCSGLIAVSTSTREDIEQVARIQDQYLWVIPNALDSIYRNTMTGHSLENRGGHENEPPLILHIGHNGQYKNRAGVLRIFAQVRKSVACRLLLIGPTPSASLLKLVQGLALQNDAQFVEGVDDAALRNLYQRASLLLFPSLYEGFGWPPLEAMACGCPVVCSSEGSLAEVVGDAALTAPAADEAQLAQLCVSVLQDQDLASTLRVKGLQHVSQFTVERMGRALLAVYQQILRRPLVRPLQQNLVD
jgi:glycosyltransferase involved in cell wall biosynthesis